MKKIYFLLFALSISFFLLSSAFAQDEEGMRDRGDGKYGWLAKSSWSLGFGFTYPRYISANVSVGEENLSNYGGFLSIKRNFSEHVGLRLKLGYINLEGNVGVEPNLITITNNTISGDFDLVYYFVPCEPVSPYLGVGVGGIYYTIENSPQTQHNDSFFDYQLNFLFGAEWRLGGSWKFITELGYHTPANTRFEGITGTSFGGILGGNSDSYMTFDLGFLVYFGLGDKSNICDLYEGLARVDYDRIEEIIRRNQTQPTEVDYNRIEEIVKKHRFTGTGTTDDNWVLLGINFDFDRATLRPEAYPVLFNAAQVLMTNPDINVEIQGHTDNIGSDNYNQRLSERRAETVRQWLVAKGVAANRLTTVGFGESKPITDNKTPQARELNRRVEFRVLNR
jgi:outer membrane protein OmpA-like peptidoglycan-associated protein